METNDRQVLVCRTDSLTVAIPLEVVREVTPLLPIRTVEGVPPYVLGVSRIRSRALAVLDVERLLTGRPGQEAMRLLTVEHAGQAAAYALREIIGVRRLDAVSGMPTFVRQAAKEMATGLEAEAGDLLFVLQESKVVPDEVSARLAKDEGGVAE